MKPAELIYSPEALQDLRAIVDYIQAERPTAAHQFVQEFDQAINRLTLFPQSGAPVRHRRLIRRNYRYVVLGEFLLFYKFRPAHLTILRLVHGRRHIVPLLLK